MRRLSHLISSALGSIAGSRFIAQPVAPLRRLKHKTSGRALPSRSRSTSRKKAYARFLTGIENGPSPSLAYKNSSPEKRDWRRERNRFLERKRRERRFGSKAHI